MRGIRIPVGLATLALVLAACQSTPSPDPTGIASPALGEANSSGGDACGRHDYAWLVGRDRSLVPPAPEGRVIRVVCSTCPMTLDYNAKRLNVVYDEKTGVVQKLSCG